MNKVNYSSQFKKDVRAYLIGDLKVEFLYTVMKMLENENELGPDYKEHKLVGKYSGYVACQKH